MPDIVQDREIVDHLNKILTSDSFTTSRRSQDFLRFVVQETLDGRKNTIKERTIAMEVFGKDHRFEPGEDSLVRVKAREVRKRLAEYYERNPEASIRIDIPRGGYIPNIQQVETESEPLSLAPVEEVPLPVEPTARAAPTRRRFLRGAAAGIAALAAWPITRYMPDLSSPLDEFWKPIFSTKNPVLISIPLLSAEDGEITDRVGMGAATAVSEAAQFFSRAQYPYRLRFGAALTFAQLHEQPSLLLGGFSSVWTTRATTPLRYTLAPEGGGQRGGSVHDAFTDKILGPVISRHGYSTEDYALVCRLFDVASGQITLIAAGITTFGTEVAARFFFQPELFAKLVEGQSGWENKNFQAVVKVSIVETTPSTPNIVATYFW